MVNVWFWTTVLLAVALVLLHIFMPWFNATYEEVHKPAARAVVATIDVADTKRSTYHEPFPNSPGRRKRQRQHRRTNNKRRRDGNTSKRA